MAYDAARTQVSGEVEFPKNCAAAWATLHVRLPSGLRVASVEPASGATILSDGGGLNWALPRGRMAFKATIRSQ